MLLIPPSKFGFFDGMNHDVVVLNGLVADESDMPIIAQRISE